ncbi:hypothetical protein ACIQGZ_24660 [Streptomyces sp. NPDC092296]|uniref:hypothetical protein n=1 Tax=Streptomyces sp. NPDC092296 TaxID=3366012 RepID=UPI00381D513C
MDMTELARQLDGRPAVTQRPYLFSGDDAEVRWVCWLYGYQVEVFRQYSTRVASAELLAVLDPDPAARARGDWMRRPDLRPGVPAPIPWTWQQPGRWPLWTPPGWPAGSGPVRPAPDRMPVPTEEQIRDRYHPAGLLVFGALFAVAAAGLALAHPAGAAALALAAVGCFLGYLPLRRYRDRLLVRAGERRPLYDPAPGTPPPPPPPDGPASDRHHREGNR